MVVAVNRFVTDTEAELELVRKMAVGAGAHNAVICSHWAKGGKGAADLAAAVDKATRCIFHATYKVFSVDTSVFES